MSDELPLDPQQYLVQYLVERTDVEGSFWQHDSSHKTEQSARQQGEYLVHAEHKPSARVLKILAYIYP